MKEDDLQLSLVAARRHFELNVKTGLYDAELLLVLSCIGKKYIQTLPSFCGNN